MLNATCAPLFQKGEAMSRPLLCLALLAPLAVLGCHDSLPMGPPDGDEVTILGPSTSVTTDAETQSARIVVTGNISTVTELSDLDLDGADITATYVISDLGAGPLNTFVGDGIASAVFDGITLVIDIENRPDGAPDILGVTAPTTVSAYNRFSPSLGVDAIGLNGGASFSVDGVHLRLFGFEAALDGTQEAISGTNPVSSLEFLLDFGPEFTPLTVPRLRGGFLGDYVYEIINLTVRIEALTPVEQLERCADAVEELENQGFLNAGESRSLVAKLDAATARLNDDMPDAAVNQLGAFINEVEALVEGGVLTSEQGQPLIDCAQAVIDDLSS